MQLSFGKEKPRRDKPASDTAPGQEAKEDDDDDKEETLPEIGILNSFFLTDIERAMSALKTGAASETLKQYLTNLPEERRTDLSTAAGHNHLISTLRPARINTGRWPSNPAHAMSLMQQFAINTAFSHLKDRGIFSVNGPPGTGKTTLLRDIFAENITRRARILASLKNPGDAFDGTVSADGGDKILRIKKLRPELTGYEMVVTSYNNTAVENISRELPQSASIELPPGEEFTYIRPVAHKLAAETKEGAFKPLKKEEYPWGLITCTLGNSANRSHFCDRVFFKKTQEDAEETWSGDERPITLWQWAKTLDAARAPQNFAEAAKNFRALDQQVSARLKDLEAFAALHDAVRTGSAQQALAECESRLHTAEAHKEQCRLRLDVAHTTADRKNRDLTDLRQDQEQLDRLKPSFWKSLFKPAETEAHTARVTENAEAQLVLRNDIRALTQQIENVLDPVLERARAACAALSLRVDECRTAISRQNTELDACKKMFPDVNLFNAATDLETEPLQRSGLWHDEKLNALRSDLFKAALTLHETWLAAVMTSRSIGFYETLMAVGTLIGSPGRRITASEEVTAIWQNFFMIVPVVSTTFASFARQFHGLGPESLGWVFVDEAGQAMPQAAVGAMHRAQRAVIIGDPLQIEPVFTLSEPLVRALCDLSPHTSDGRCSPAKASVQTLADAANPYGTRLNVREAEPIWVGSPLRVHRRCLDPMFTIANRIAYDGKMIHGSTNPSPGIDKPPLPAPSAWFQVAGPVAGRQTVPAQINFVVTLLLACYSRGGKLPALYVISPFREIKFALRTALRDPFRWKADGLRPPKELDVWISKRIGTVHTFQGKEEDTVIMVLGTDASKRGSAQWAASKPNILNVAITRAKRRFYIVGDRNLWAGLNYFSDAATMLPEISTDAILETIITADQSA